MPKAPLTLSTFASADDWTDTAEGRAALSALTLEQVQQARAHEPSAGKGMLHSLCGIGGLFPSAFGLVGAVLSLAFLALVDESLDLGDVERALLVIPLILGIASGVWVGLELEERGLRKTHPLTVKRWMQPLSELPDPCAHARNLLDDPEVRAYRDKVVAHRHLVRLDVSAMEEVLAQALQQRLCREVHGLLEPELSAAH